MLGRRGDFDLSVAARRGGLSSVPLEAWGQATADDHPRRRRRRRGDVLRRGQTTDVAKRSCSMFKGTAWQLEAFGDAEDVLRQRTWPAPAEGHVLVRVVAAGVSPPDLLAARGWLPSVQELPAVLGMQAAGEIVAVPRTSRLSVGDRVMGLTAIFSDRLGGHADYAYLIEAETRRIPAALTDAQAAGFVVGFRTAHTALVDRCGLSKGETLVVLGAAGNSGEAALLLGKALGTKVVAVASSACKLAYCRDLGADDLVNHTEEDVAQRIIDVTEGRGADVIFDPVDGRLTWRCSPSLASDDLRSRDSPVDLRRRLIRSTWCCASKARAGYSASGGSGTRFQSAAGRHSTN